MRTGILLATSIFLMANAGAATSQVQAEHFAEKDMSSLANKLTKALRKCQVLKRGGNVIVDLENRTAEDVNRTRFSQLIHSMLEGQTHAVPETKPADFEIHAVLEMQKQAIHMATRITYTLRAEVAQADEVLCKKRVKLIKQNPSALH